MNSDARISVGLPAHPKTKKLIKRAGQEAAWNLVCLFLWAAQNRPRGDLSGMSDEDIELAAGWEGADGAFVDILAEIRFLDGAEGERRLHDWEEHNPWAAGAEERSMSSRWAALCKRHGREKAAELMPDYALRVRGAHDPHATGTESHCAPHADAQDPQCPVSVSVSNTDTNSAALTRDPASRKPKKPRLTTLPEGFAVSDRVRRWATEKGHDHLDEHFEYFVSYARRKGATYADWDEALMTAIRDNWAKLGTVVELPKSRTPSTSAIMAAQGLL